MLSSLFKTKRSVVKDVTHFGVKVYIIIYILCYIKKMYIVDIFSESSRPIWTKLGIYEPKDKGYHRCLNRRPTSGKQW